MELGETGYISSVASFTNTSTVQLISSSNAFHFSCLLTRDFYGHITRCCSQKISCEQKNQTRHNIFTTIKSVDLELSPLIMQTFDSFREMVHLSMLFTYGISFMNLSWVK